MISPRPRIHAAPPRTQNGTSDPTSAREREHTRVVDVDVEQLGGPTSSAAAASADPPPSPPPAGMCLRSTSRTP